MPTVIYNVIPIPDFLRVQKDSTVKEHQRVPIDSAKELIRHGFFAAGSVVILNPDQNPDQCLLKFTGVGGIKLGPFQPFGRKEFNCRYHFVRRMNMNSLQYFHAPIKLGLGRVVQ